MREVRIDGAEWRCVGRLDLLARDLWCPLGCGGDSLHVYCEFSGRRSWSLYSFLLSNSSPLYWSLALCFFYVIGRLYDRVTVQFLEATSYGVVSIR